MLNKISEFFKRRRVKKYSSTLTKANVGSSSKRELNPEINSILKRLSRSKKMSVEDLNKLLVYYFEKDPLETNVFTLTSYIKDTLCFELTGAKLMLDKNDDVFDIKITLREFAYNTDLTLTLNIQDFYDFFKPIEMANLTEGVKGAH